MFISQITVLLIIMSLLCCTAAFIQAACSVVGVNYILVFLCFSLVVWNIECQQHPCNIDFINAKEISASVVHKDKMYFINKVVVLYYRGYGRQEKNDRNMKNYEYSLQINAYDHSTFRSLRILL